jgi:hypothetical protein
MSVIITVVAPGQILAMAGALGSRLERPVPTLDWIWASF